MKRAFIAILLLLVFLLSGVGSASAYIDAEPKNRVGDFFGGNNEVIWKNQLPALGNTRGNHYYAYDSATGVWDYVVQNPWSAFDPLGLKVNEKRKVKQDESGSGPYSDYKESRGWDNLSGKERRKVQDDFQSAKDVAKENKIYNHDNKNEIAAWDSYDKIKGMMGGSEAWQKMWNYLDSPTVERNGKQLPLVVNVTMDAKGVDGSVGMSRLENGVVTIDIKFDPASMNGDATDILSGQVRWHTVPHETYHAVEKINMTVDPLKMGTVPKGEESLRWNAFIPTSGGNRIQTSEARAARAGNIVARQTKFPAISSKYVGRNGIAVKVPNP